MNKKILNPVLILGGISLGLGFYGLPKELYPSLLSYAGFLPPYIGAFLTAFGIMNYSGVKWYWKVVFSVPLMILIGFVLLIMGMVIFTH